MENKISEHTINDVTLLCEGKQFRCSRQILAEESKYFKAMFYGHLKESQSDDAILIHDITAVALETLVKYCKTKKFTATVDNVFYMLETSTLFQFDLLQTTCIEFVRSSLDANNCLATLGFSDYLGIEILRKFALHFALWEFDVVSRGTEILEVQKEILISYLLDGRLRTRSELNVFRCLEKWILHDYVNREQHFLDIVGVVRFGQLSSEDLDSILHSTIVMKNPKVFEAIQRVNKLKCKNKTSCTSEILHIAENLTERTIESVPVFLCEAKTGVNFNPERNIVYYDTQMKRLCKLTSLNSINEPLIVGYNLVSVGQDIYVTERSFGWRNEELVSKMWSYNVLINKWKTCLGLRIPRRLHSMCAFDGYVYVIGGIGDCGTLLSDVCRYDAVKGEWEDLRSLPRPVLSGVCTAHSCYIYVLMDQVFRFDPRQNIWTTESLLPKGMVSVALSHENGIYFIDRLRTLYLYNPAEDGVEGTCTIVGQFKYRSATACIVGNEVYAFNYDNQLHCVIEVYDIRNNMFRVDNMIDGEVPQIIESCPMVPMFK